MRRRTFLGAALGGAAALALPRRARAFGDTARLVIGQIQHGGRWNPRPTGLRRLCWELVQRTSIEAGEDAAPVRLGQPGLHRTPMLYLSGDGALPPFPEPELAALRRHLQQGGFLLVDAADGSDGAGFDASVRRELARLLPASPLTRVAREHVLYKSFYLLDHQGGRVLAKPWLEAQVLNGRLAVVYSQNDLAGAWARGAFGDWEYECTPGGEPQRETAFRLGVNLAMYALCTDYKDDAVHLPFILRRRS
ncbi:DUF4159 domain-containing protein [Anaeromyxobacter paludicola]|uniref:DUF4159 domain-containing protein n=1 Tax=Anaeromyxobacter paludicola TaxID=2918171 RepID=A0ABN6N522_9BACT|nr:DUF4159 domain-containing protein [Anaeromyxobacter paludicola]BDG08136.1 hypothetical protein AMPC_12490 [Anaeromyxobacter paludicola]